MVSCPKCGSEDCVKDGIVNGRQRYRCKKCVYRHTVSYRGKHPNLKRKALELYLEGLGFRSIGRFLRCSHVAVYNWIKAFGESIEGIRSASGVKIVEMDEMHTYIGSKKTSAGYGLLLIEMGSGLSTAYWAPEVQKQGRNYGKASKKKQSNQ